MKHLVDNFDYTFFPFAFDFKITASCDDIDDIEVFGASDSDKITTYQSAELKEKG
jgi:hypothetical protein